MSSLLITILVIVLFIIISVALYNGLVKMRIRVEEAWSDITVQLKRRYDLIPNVVSTVKGYATHEKEVFERVTEARANALASQGKGVHATAAAENEFEQTLKSLFAVAEAYPQLRASENFQQLQTELTDTEDKIMASRRYYNSAARDFNIKVDTVPSSIIAKMFGFKKREFFEVADMAAVEKPVDVSF